MSAEQKLREAAAIGDELAELVERFAPGTDQQAQQARERWTTLMGGCARADLIPSPSKPSDHLEEWGESAASRTVSSLPKPSG